MYRHLLDTLQPPQGRAWHGGPTPLGSLRGHDRLVHAIRRFGTQRWNRVPPGARKWRYGDLIVGIVAHEVYHTGQIQIMKRLYRNRFTPSLRSRP